MAKVVSTELKIRLSKLVRDSEDSEFGMEEADGWKEVIERALLELVSETNILVEVE